MKMSYRIPDRNDKVESLAKKITELLVSSAVTYQEADDALTIAQEMLLRSTRPVNIPDPRPSDSE